MVSDWWVAKGWSEPASKTPGFYPLLVPTINHPLGFTPFRGCSAGKCISQTYGPHSLTRRAWIAASSSVGCPDTFSSSFNHVGNVPRFACRKKWPDGPAVIRENRCRARCPLQQLENSIVGDSSLYLRAVAGWRNRDRMTIRSVTAIPTAPPSTDCSSDGSEHVGAVRLNRTECTLIGSSFP